MKQLVNVVKPSRYGRLLLKGSVVVCAFLLVIPAVTWADTLPTDPYIEISTGGDALPVSGNLNNVTPTGADPVSFSFFNDTATIITSLSFSTTINTGLSSMDITNAFGCTNALDSTGLGYDYFLHCAVGYNSNNGLLTYSFFGVDPPDGEEVASIDTEMNEHEGIPVLGTCDPNLDPQNCTFTITLHGWTSGLTVGGDQIYSALPTFHNALNTPEPSFVGLLAFQCLLLVGIAGVVHRRAKRKASAS